MRAPLIALSLLLAGCSVATEVLEPEDGRVLRVVDGDTIRVSLDGVDTSVRLIGVDTPETRHPQRGQECFGKAATTFMRELLDRELVELTFDAEPRDRYGRTLAYVYRARDRLFVNLELVERGFAQVLTVPPNVAHADEFVAAQRRARAAGAGLWSACPAARGTGPGD